MATQMVLIPLGGVGEGRQVGRRPGADSVHLSLLKLLQKLISFIKLLLALLVSWFFLHTFA